MRVASWISASRIGTLPAALAPVLIGSSMAVWHHQFHLLSAVAAAVAAICIQIGTNFANDYFDFIKGADTDKRLGPARMAQTGAIRPVHMKRGFILMFGLAAVIGAGLMVRGGWPILVIGVTAILSGILYTGGPYPFGYIGLGEVFVFIFFGPVAVAGTYYVQALSISQDVLIAGIAPGCLSTAVLIVNNLRDIPTDRQAGKYTIAVRFGPLFTKWEYVVCIATAVVATISMFTLYQHYILGIAVTLPIAAYGLLNCRNVWVKTGRDLNRVLVSTAHLLAVHSLLFSIIWML